MNQPAKQSAAAAAAAAAAASCRLRPRRLSLALLVSIMLLLLLPTTEASSTSSSSATTRNHHLPPFIDVAEADYPSATNGGGGGDTDDALVRCCGFEGTRTARRGCSTSPWGPALQEALISTPRGGGGGGGGGPSSTTKSVAAAAKSTTATTTNAKAKITKTSSSSRLLPAWFRPNKSLRERHLSAALLVWNALAIVDAVRFTFYPHDNLRGYFVEAHASSLSSQVIVMTRFLANCQWAYLATSIMVALTASNEVVLKSAFGIAIVATMGAFRAVALGIDDGVILQPWKSKYASLLTLPPLLLLAYFAFAF